MEIIQRGYIFDILFVEWRIDSNSSPCATIPDA